MESVFRILGPLEVELRDGAIALGRRERALLGILLLNSGEVVSIERLIDGVWGDTPPSSAKHMLHEYVSRLRIAIGDASVIQTRVPGYIVTCGDGELDVRVFSELVTAARAAAGTDDHERALGLYERALGLWRGDVLADVQLEGDARIDVERLDQERQLVSEERFDCALALGHHRRLIPELERHVSNAPLRERPRAQLMLALYRAGRQIEALDCYRDARALLVHQAGVEPGRDLRQLERSILTQDASLDLARARHGEPAAEPAARRRWVLVGALGAPLLVALGVLVLVLVLGRSHASHSLTQIDANAVGAIDPAGNRLVDEVAVGAGPGRLATGLGSLWVVNAFNDSVSRIDPATGGEQRIPVCAGPTAIAVGAELVWVACSGSRSVEEINPQNNRRVEQIPVGAGPSAIAISPGRVWVTDRLDDTVTEIDSNAGRRLRTLDAGPSPSDIAYGFGALWVTNESSATVTRLDPVTGVSQSMPVGNGPEAVTVADGSIWVANSLDGTVSRIDPSRGALAHTVTVGAGPSSVLARPGAIWVADSYSSRVVRIDPRTNDVVGTVGVGSAPQSVAAIDGRIWLSARATSATHRGGTLRLFDPQVPDSLDSAVGYAGSAWSVFSDTGDGLVGFKRVDGLDGGTLVPDLATALPKPGNGGLTYSFQLRRGIRYSNGDLVHASDVRRALERVLRMGPGGLDYYSKLVGADACSRTRCDLAGGIVTDDRQGTVTLKLRAPDPDLEYELALPFAYPVPPSVSMTKPERLGAPGTGPYMIESFRRERTSAQVVLVRNPHFREWSAAAQPRGYPDRIVWTYNHAYDE